MKLVSTANFTLFKTGKRFFVRGHDRQATPAGRRISARDARYLQSLNSKPTTAAMAGITEFDQACVWDMGVGVFAR